MAFPSSPTNGQIAVVNGIRYSYDSTVRSWTRLISSAKFTAAASAPSDPALGDEWYNTNLDILFQYVNDGTTSYWIDIQSLGQTGNITQIGSSTLEGNIVVGVTDRYSIGAANGYVANVFVNNLTANAITVSGNIVSGNIVPSANVTYDLGSSNFRFKDLWLSGNTIYFGGASLASDGSNVTISNPSGGSFTVTGTTPGAGIGAGTGTFGNINLAERLTFTGTGSRISGDFSNATIADRVMFQTSTTDGNTVLNLIPNGTGTICAFEMDSKSNLTDSSTGSLNLISNTDVRLQASVRGAGTYLPLTFYTGGSEAMRIDTSKNIGINVSDPGYRLDIAAADTTANFGYALRLRTHPTAGAVTLQFTDNPVTTELGAIVVDTSNNMKFLTGGTERVRINFAGAVGIGTVSPIRQLTVSYAGSPEIALQDTTQAANSRNWRVFTAGNSLIIGTLNDAGTSGSDKMIFDSGGGIKIADASGKILNSSGRPILQHTGSILQRQYVYHTSTSQLTSTGAFHELTTSLRIAFTPVSTTSTLFLTCYGSFVSPQSNNLQYAAFYDVTNAAYVNLPPLSGSKRQVHWFNRTTSFDVNDAAFMYFTVPVANSSTTARTYTVYHSTEGSVIQFLTSTLSTASGATYPLYFEVVEVAG